MTKRLYQRRLRNLLLDTPMQMRVASVWLIVSSLCFCLFAWKVYQTANAGFVVSHNSVLSRMCGTKVASGVVFVEPAAQVAAQKADALVTECLVRQESDIDRLRYARDRVARGVIGGGVFFLFVVAVFAIRITHRVAGPAYKIRSYLDDWIRGSYGVLHPLRKTDYLGELYIAFQRAYAWVSSTEKADASRMKHWQDSYGSNLQDTPNNGMTKDVPHEGRRDAGADRGDLSSDATEAIAESSQSNRRLWRNFLLDNSLQLHIAGCVVATVFVIGVCLGWLVLQQHHAMDVVLAKDADLAGIWVQWRNEQSVWQVVYIVIGALMVGMATVCLMVVVTHRIAGPAHKLQKFLLAISHGRFTNLLPMRKGDMLWPLYWHYRQAQKAVIGRMLDNRDTLLEWQRQTEQTGLGAGSTAHQELIAHIKDIEDRML